MIKKLFTLAVLGVVTAGVTAKPTQAALSTSPYLFTTQAATSTGQFEWDEFTGTAGDPHAPDVASSGIGSGTLSATFIPQPMDGPPFALLTGTENIYSGGTLGDFDINLSGLSDAKANTTVVLQLSLVGLLTPASISLGGASPNTLVDRGTAFDVLHNTDSGGGAPNDTHFYWAEWQVASAASYLIEFTHPNTHTSFAQARVDYFNVDSRLSALVPNQVPEPTTMALAAGVGLLVARWRRR